MLPIQSIAHGIPLAAAQNASSTKPSAGIDLFGDTFRSATQEIGKLDADAQSAVTGLLSGQGVEVHDA